MAQQEGADRVLMYILDTMALSALMRADRAASERLLQVRPSDVRLPQPVVAEVHYGLSRLPRSKRKLALQQRFELLLDAIERISWSDEVSQAFGHLKAELEKKGTRVDDFDVAIAAHAVAHDAILVTANLRHFTRIPGLTVEAWSDGG